MSHTPTHDQIIEQLRSERDEARATLENAYSEIESLQDQIEGAKQEGIRLGLKAAASEVRNNTVDDIFWAVLYADRVRRLDPDRILAEAQKESGDDR